MTSKLNKFEHVWKSGPVQGARVLYRGLHGPPLNREQDTTENITLLKLCWWETLRGVYPVHLRLS